MSLNCSSYLSQTAPFCKKYKPKSMILPPIYRSVSTPRSMNRNPLETRRRKGLPVPRRLATTAARAQQASVASSSLPHFPLLVHRAHAILRAESTPDLCEPRGPATPDVAPARQRLQRHMLSTGKTYIRQQAHLGVSVQATAAGALETNVALARDRFTARAGDTIRTQAVISLKGVADPRLFKLPATKLRLVLCVDMSTSMQGMRCVQCVEAIRDLFLGLSAGDVIALVAFSDAAVVVDRGTTRADGATPGEAAFLEKLAALTPKGKTNLLDGLKAAFAVLAEIWSPKAKNHIVLLSDGRPSSTRGILDFTRDATAGGNSVSCVGVGTKFNEDLLLDIAADGCGNFYYASDVELADKMMRELRSLQVIVAKQLSVRLRAAPGVAIDNVMGFPFLRDASRAAEAVVVHIGDLSESDSGREVLVLLSWTAVPSDAPARRSLLGVEIRYVCPLSGQKNIATTLSALVLPAEGGATPRDAAPRVLEAAPVVHLVVDKMTKVAVANVLTECAQRLATQDDRLGLRILGKQIEDLRGESLCGSEVAASLMEFVGDIRHRLKDLRSGAQGAREAEEQRLRLVKELKVKARELLRK
eukprot:gnl/Chilomastix_cuspidata/5128.p1 GENE.gnl/Chilomastix_cuspidata/5128~~gnl/Chilomastix_cuspidata/5128.p1  ORF type:complete len:658 (-),score=261.96 gnl/Chilomastix_cuspidata/5128:88-1851(-)